MSKQKLKDWIYTDEVTKKEHTVLVHLVTEGDKISFTAAAELKIPGKPTEKIYDTDENAQSLRVRIFARLTEEITWVPYFLVTNSAEGFHPDLFASGPRRRCSSITFLVDDIEIGTLSSGLRFWRGREGGNHRFSSQVKPGLPPTQTARGYSCYFEDTSTNRVSLNAEYKKFAKVAKGMLAAADQKNIGRTLHLFATQQEDTHWKDISREDSESDVSQSFRKASTTNAEEKLCQPKNESNSESSEPSVDAKAVSPTACISRAT